MGVWYKVGDSVCGVYFVEMIVCGVGVVLGNGICFVGGVTIFMGAK